MTAAPQLQDLTLETIRDALSYISPDMRRWEWARIGMALKCELGDDGFELFDDWSKDGESYNEKDCRDTWKSIKPLGGVTINTLIYEAQQHGFDLKDATRKTLTQDEILARRKKREEDHAREEAERRRMQGEAAKMANLILKEAVEADDSHQYLVDKQVRAHGLFIGKWPLINDNGEAFKWLPGALLLPIIDAKNGKVISLQGMLVNADGTVTKRYLKNGRKQGGYHLIGPVPGPGEILAFCEGYATGATVHELTGWTVVVCFDGGNIPGVAQLLRDAFPQAAFVICADNDAWSKTGDIENPGLHYANKAAQETRGLVLVPKFHDVATRPTDFNDLAALEGPNAARAQLLDNPITRTQQTAPAPANDNTPAADVDYYTPLVHVNTKGKPLATLENLQEICRRLGVTVRYNVISKEDEILIPGQSFLIDNQANASFSWLESELAKFNMASDKLAGFVTYLADKNPFNPVANWITSKPWDGKPRLQQLFDTVKPVEDKRLPDGRKLSDTLIMRWMISAVAAAFEPRGVSAHGILVMQGDQYLGKTKWFKQLVPEDLGVLQDGMMLRPDDRDSVKQICSFWLVELGELDATFRKSDIAALKAFVTRKQDVLRRAYARKESSYARRTVFFGSVNPREFLSDPTGNRRYWTIECAFLDLVAQAALDMQQVWAEVLALYQQGEGFYLSPEEMAALNQHNEQFQTIDPIEERLQTRLIWDTLPETWEWKTSTEILIKVGVERPTPVEASRASQCVRKLNGGRFRRSNGKNLLLCPPAPDELNDRPY